jgi:peptidoglycan/xylan/chitin deacetylase (PgdA/CDA1 family)
MAKARVAGLLVAALVGLVTATAPVVTVAAQAAVTPCSRGLVALTFDDGPAAAVTPALVDVLVARKVPATFFVVGERVRATPAIVRRTARLGFTIGNHTYRHENLTKLGDAAIASTLRRTRTAIRDAGVTPSALMRPPYGAIDAHVRAVVARLGMVPVMWTIDPKDWRTGRRPETIADLVIGALRPHEENLVLLHDGVRNSPNTLKAVPRIITRARTAGYCFAALGPHGHPTAPVPAAAVGGAVGTERRPGHTTTVAVPVTLYRATSRQTSVRVRSVGDGAVEGEDFVAVDTRVVFPAGTTRRLVKVVILGDDVEERTERVGLRLSAPRGVVVEDGTGVVRILDGTSAAGAAS